MSNISWFQQANIGDYVYVKLYFTSNALNINNVGPVLTFCVGWSNTWHVISASYDIVQAPENHNLYIITVPPVNAQGANTIFLVLQSGTLSPLPEPQSPLIKDGCTYNVPPTGGNYYYKVVWNGTIWTINSCLQSDPFSNEAACFSYKTLSLLFNDIKKKKFPPIICRELRGNKKMYRCNYPKYGILEFTEDHPFFYRKKLYTFDQLAKIHPIIKKTATKIDIDDEECGKNAYIYNVIWHPEHLNITNMLTLNHNLLMVGGSMKDYMWHIAKKKMSIIGNIMKDNNINSYYSKYSKENAIEYYKSDTKSKINIFLFFNDDCRVIELY